MLKTAFYVLFGNAHHARKHREAQRATTSYATASGDYFSPVFGSTNKGLQLKSRNNNNEALSTLDTNQFLHTESGQVSALSRKTSLLQTHHKDVDNALATTGRSALVRNFNRDREKRRLEHTYSHQ